MIVFPNCKINLGLNILNKRADGYHNIETVFYPLPFYDVLEIIQHSNTSQSCELIASGINIEAKDEDNLCVKAWHLLKKYFPQLPPVKIYLHKAIPIGGGLGGGSADGAFMLMLLNTKFNLNLSQQQLLSYALMLGSDCPFFIINKPCFAQQRGEVLQPVSLNLSGYKLLFINPGIQINTGWAFSKVNFSTSNNIETIILKPVEEWKATITNDFESPVFEKYPEIKVIKDKLYEQGALFASMSGSGSTVYGIFKKDLNMVFNIFQPHFIKELLL